MKITNTTLISEALKLNDKAAEILMRNGMGCLGCPSSQMETLEQAAEIHGLSLENLLAELNKGLETPGAKAAEMFCYQCEQTAGSKACVKVGVCGKNATVAALQDLLIHQMKGIAFYAMEAIKKGEKLSDKVNKFTMDGLFSTLTNVSFEEAEFAALVVEANKIKTEVKALAGEIKVSVPVIADYMAPENIEEMIVDAAGCGIMADITLNPRHQRLVIVDQSPITDRLFSVWQMAYQGPSPFVSRHLTKLLSARSRSEQRRLAEWVTELAREFTVSQARSTNSGR